jgi:hypothetical protein
MSSSPKQGYSRDFQPEATVPTRPLDRTWSVAFVEAKEEKPSRLDQLRQSVRERVARLRPAAQRVATRVIARGVAIAAPAAVALLASQAVRVRHQARARRRALAQCEPTVLEAKAEPAGPGLLRVVVQVVVQKPGDLER